MADNTLCTEERLHWTARGAPRCTPHPKVAERILDAEQEDAGFDYQERTRRQDLRYLQRHPEVRAITAMIIELALTFRPATPVSVFFSEFFSRPREEIERKLQPFLETQTYEEDGRFKRRDTTVEQLDKEAEGMMVDRIDRIEKTEEKRTTERSQLLKNLDRMRKIGLTEMPKIAPDLVSLKSAGAVSIQSRIDELQSSPTGSIAVSEVTTTGSQQSLVFSQSIEDFLISLQVKKRDKDENEEIVPSSVARPSRSQFGTKILIATPEEKIGSDEPERDRKLKTIRNDLGNRPKRPLVIKHKSGLYTVEEVEEP